MVRQGNKRGKGQKLEIIHITITLTKEEVK